MVALAEAPGVSAAPERKLASPARASPAKASAIAVTPDEEAAPSVKPSSLIQMLEGREDKLALWVGIAISFFIIGWICGGNFYLRRDRRRSRKLTF
ncbi:MAG: hypothetical protein ACREQ7_18230 [Candidatus Binatia bacterium]